MSTNPTSLCRGCGKPIVWAKDPTGKAIPLDPRPPVYLVTSEDDEARCVRQPNSMVSHFATCPAANQFSGSSRRPAS